MATQAVDDAVACRAGFARHLVTRFRTLGPMTDVLYGALDLPFWSAAGRRNDLR